MIKVELKSEECDIVDALIDIATQIQMHDLLGRLNEKKDGVFRFETDDYAVKFQKLE